MTIISMIQGIPIPFAFKYTSRHYSGFTSHNTPQFCKRNWPRPFKFLTNSVEFKSI